MGGGVEVYALVDVVVSHAARFEEVLEWEDCLLRIGGVQTSRLRAQHVGEAQEVRECGGLERKIGVYGLGDAFDLGSGDVHDSAVGGE